MKFERVPPQPSVKDYVRYFWKLESAPDDRLSVLGPLADGCPGLIFQPSDKGIFYDPYQKRVPSIFLLWRGTYW